MGEGQPTAARRRPATGSPTCNRSRATVLKNVDADGRCSRGLSARSTTRWVGGDELLCWTGAAHPLAGCFIILGPLIARRDGQLFKVEQKDTDFCACSWRPSMSACLRRSRLSAAGRLVTFYMAGPIYVAAYALFLERIGWRRAAAVFVGFLRRCDCASTVLGNAVAAISLRSRWRPLLSEWRSS